MIVLVATTLGGGDGGASNDHPRGGGKAAHSHPVNTPKYYEVQSGDTLTSIAHKTGVTVVRIRRLNPGIDPQILISGEQLKLK